EPLVTTIKIPDADIRAGRGVLASPPDANSGKAPTGKVIPDFIYDWATQGVRAAPGTMRFSTTLKADQFGTYSFRLKNASDDPAAGELLVDGYSVKAGQPITLGQGLHSVVATDTVKTASGVTELLW